MGRLQRAPNPLFPAAGVAAQERGGNGVACKVVKTKRGLNPNEAACCKNKVASRRNKVGLCFFRVRPCFFSAGWRLNYCRSAALRGGAHCRRQLRLLNSCRSVRSSLFFAKNARCSIKKTGLPARGASGPVFGGAGSLVRGLGAGGLPQSHSLSFSMICASSSSQSSGLSLSMRFTASRPCPIFVSL